MIENKLYRNKIIYKEQTPYQKIVVTAINGRIQLYINGAIQFDTIDEYRYHESLVHPAMLTAKAHESILIIGGGDGMALREVLKYEDVDRVTLVDLDPAITTLFKRHKTLSRLNNHSYSNPKVTVVNQDAWKFIEKSQTLYDVIIVDLPDPNSISLSRLYSRSFYHLLKKQLSKGGAVVTQASSPLYTHKAFWSIEQTLRDTNLHTLPYHTYIPSFGEWGFVLASRFKIELNSSNLPKSLKYINSDILQKSTIFPMDIAKVKVDGNSLSRHALIEYYNEGGERWYE
jgi:spermidine synthase